MDRRRADVLLSKLFLGVSFDSTFEGRGDRSQCYVVALEAGTPKAYKTAGRTSARTRRTWLTKLLVNPGFFTHFAGASTTNACVHATQRACAKALRRLVV